MGNIKRAAVEVSVSPKGRQRRVAGKERKPVARWITRDRRRLLVLENAHFAVEIRPDMGGAITRYVDRATGIDVIWRNPYGQPPRQRVLDQPMAAGSDLYDVMDGSWYVSLPNGFFADSYFGAPLGTHGELRSLPWEVERITARATKVTVALVGRSVRTPLVYRRTWVVSRDTTWLTWHETVDNRANFPLPIVWLQHPTFGGPLLAGARLIVPARTVSVYRNEVPEDLQLQAGYSGSWPLVPERATGQWRDCSVVLPPGAGTDHSVQLTGFDLGWGCLWNEGRSLGFALEWDAKLFPYAWSWNSAGGEARYPLWGEGHVVTLQPSTSPVGRFSDLVKSGHALEVPAKGSVSTILRTGFVRDAKGPWHGAEVQS